jgi:hypothetical protein
LKCELEIMNTLFFESGHLCFDELAAAIKVLLRFVYFSFSLT